MMNMKFKKIMAVTLATTMTLGSAVTVSAADADSATGTGTALEHVNKDVISVTLPTEDDVATVFNYYVDPEGVIKEAGKMLDETSITGNDDGVYFKTGDSTYASTSKAVEIEGKNSVDVDVTVKATVTAGENDIALVADEAALTAATTPALLMKLVVGTDEKAILSTGATAKGEIAGVDSNFEMVVSEGKYVYQAKSGATGWNKTSVKLVGKTNDKDVTTGMTAPQINLVWTIAKHTDAYVSATTISAAANSLTLSLPENVTVSSVALYKASAPETAIALAAGNQYKVDNGKITVPADMITAWGAGSKITITYSDAHTDDVTIQ